MKGEANPIYLDHNATTPVAPEVVEAMLPYLREHFGNPSSAHVYGQRAHRAVDHAREQVAALLGCHPDEVLFTSGGTEANNLAIRGVAAARPDRRRVVTSVVEHPATEQPCRHLEDQGYQVIRVTVDSWGRVDPDEVLASVDGGTALVTIMHANNEVGTLQPIREIARTTRERGVPVHTDAAQSVGKVPVCVEDLGMDLLSVAGHKLYAPKGVGALYVRRGTPLHPVLLGASHERGLRPGTENVASIVGLGVACELASQELAAGADRMMGLRDRLWELLVERIPGIELNGHPTHRLPNTLNVRFPGVRGSAVLAGAPEIAASTGSACHEGGEAPSTVLTAMGIETDDALGSLRLSLGRYNTMEDIEETALALAGSFQVLNRKNGDQS